MSIVEHEINLYSFASNWKISTDGSVYVISFILFRSNQNNEDIPWFILLYQYVYSVTTRIAICDGYTSVHKRLILSYCTHKMDTILYMIDRIGINN